MVAAAFSISSPIGDGGLFDMTPSMFDLVPPSPTDQILSPDLLFEKEMHEFCWASDCTCLDDDVVPDVKFKNEWIGELMDGNQASSENHSMKQRWSSWTAWHHPLLPKSHLKVCKSLDE